MDRRLSWQLVLRYQSDCSCSWLSKLAPKKLAYTVKDFRTTIEGQEYRVVVYLPDAEQDPGGPKAKLELFELEQAVHNSAMAERGDMELYGDLIDGPTSLVFSESGVLVTNDYSEVQYRRLGPPSATMIGRYEAWFSLTTGAPDSDERSPVTIEVSQNRYGCRVDVRAWMPVAQHPFLSAATYSRLVPTSPPPTDRDMLVAGESPVAVYEIVLPAPAARLSPTEGLLLCGRPDTLLAVDIENGRVVGEFDLERPYRPVQLDIARWEPKSRRIVTTENFFSSYARSGHSRVRLRTTRSS